MCKRVMNILLFGERVLVNVNLVFGIILSIFKPMLNFSCGHSIQTLLISNSNKTKQIRFIC